LNGETKRARQRQNRAIIAADVRRFAHVSKRIEFSVHTVAPKYRNPKNRSETWAGRGAMPRWLAAEIKKGKKREDFAINKSAAKAKKGPGKKTRGKRKVTASAESATA
jgi:DNA-binding protein H-NS